MPTVYALRYGDLYYAPPTGIFGTNLTAKTIRRTASPHALLAFVFGSVIVALLINTVASLLR